MRGQIKIAFRLAWIGTLVACLTGCAQSRSPEAVFVGDASTQEGADVPPQFGLSNEPTDRELRQTAFFHEPLIPIGGASEAGENGALALAIRRDLARGDQYATDALDQFVRSHPRSPWRASLLTSLGVLYRQMGRYQEALAAWDEAWSLTRAETSVDGRAIADRAVSELALLNAQLGRRDRLDELAAILDRRPPLGSASERYARAQIGRAMMETHPERSYRCGPLAVASMWTVLHPGGAVPHALVDATSTSDGTSLAQLIALGAAAGEPMRALRREPGTPWLVPSVVHWKVNHFAAIVAVEEPSPGRRVYVLRDSTFGEDVRISERWLNEEASGYVLVPARSPIPLGWNEVSDTEAAAVWGRGETTETDADAFGDRDLLNSSCPNSRGVARFGFHHHLAALHVEDTPVWVNQAFGPAVEFRVAYNQADWTQPQLPSYANFGGRWTFNFGGALTSTTSGPVYAMVMNGGGVVRLDPVINPVTDLRNGDRLEDVPGVPDDKRIRHLDGSYDLYRRLSPSFATRWFLKERRDAQNNAVVLSYDSSFRLTTITAASGESLTVEYRSNTLGTQSYYLVSRVSSSAGRVANFAYGEREPGGPLVLTSTTDAASVTSSYAYSTVNRTVLVGGVPVADDAGTPIPDRDFLSSMTTPYGTTTFTTGWSQVHGSGPSNNLYLQRWVEAAHPTGEHERVEFRQVTTAAGDCSASAQNSGLSPCLFRDPAGSGEWYPPAYRNVLILNGSTNTPDGPVNLNFRNSYYWNTAGYARGRTVSSGLATFDPRHAHVYHWIHRPHPSLSTAPLLESEVPPGQSRIYYAYEQQSDPQFLPSLTGGVTWYRPVLIARLQQDAVPSSQQVTRVTYTVHGNIQEAFDTVNRTRCMTWSADGTDLLSVHALPCSLLPSSGREADPTQRLYRLEYEGSLHLPYRVTDASGQVTRHYFNVRGQLVRSVYPNSQALDITYALPSSFAGSGTSDIAATEGFPYLLARSSGGPSGSSPARRYQIGRYWDGTLASLTDPEGVQRSFAWDSIERLQSITSSRGTQLFDYRIRDEAGAVVGTATGLEPTRITRENGETVTRSYDALRRPIRVATTGEVVRYRYNRSVGAGLDRVQMLRGDANDDVVTRWTAGNAPAAMPGDVQGPVNPLFQQSPASRERPLGSPSELTSWTRDAVGRVVSLSEGAQSWRIAYRADNLLASICDGTTCAGTVPRTDFTYEPTSGDPSYSSHTQRVRFVARANDANGSHQQEIRYVPFGSNGALRRSLVQDTTPFGLASQSVTYSYDVIGRPQSIVTPNDTLSFYYDALGRPERVTSAAYPGQNLRRYLYAAGDTSSRATAEEMPVYGCNATRTYDATHDYLPSGRSVTPTAGTPELIGFARTYDARNRLATEQIAGGNRYHQYDTSGRIMWSDDFVGGAWLYRDNYYNGSGNLNSYARSGSVPTFSEVMTFDLLDRIQIRSRTGLPANWVIQDSRGRVTDDGDYTYAWDANDRLTTVTLKSGGTSWQFRYDGTGRLRRFQEGGIWHGLSWVDGKLYAEYLGSESTQTLAVRQFHMDGMTQGGVRYRFERDARGSVRAVLASGQVAHAWTYDTWGNRTDAGGPVSGLEPRMAFAGYVIHAPTGLLFTPSRVYQPSIRRWLSRDPLGERRAVDGNNLYAYAANDPVNYIDPSGNSVGDMIVAGLLGAAWGGSIGGITAYIDANLSGGCDVRAQTARGVLSGAVSGFVSGVGGEVFGAAGGLGWGLAGGLGGFSGGLTAEGLDTTDWGRRHGFDGSFDWWNVGASTAGGALVGSATGASGARPNVDTSGVDLLRTQLAAGGGELVSAGLSSFVSLLRSAFPPISPAPRP